MHTSPNYQNTPSKVDWLLPQKAEKCFFYISILCVFIYCLSSASWLLSGSGATMCVFVCHTHSSKTEHSPFKTVFIALFSLLFFSYHIIAFRVWHGLSHDVHRHQSSGARSQTRFDDFAVLVGVFSFERVWLLCVLSWERVGARHCIWRTNSGSWYFCLNLVYGYFGSDRMKKIKISRDPFVIRIVMYWVTHANCRCPNLRSNCEWNSNLGPERWTPSKKIQKLRTSRWQKKSVFFQHFI